MVSRFSSLVHFTGFTWQMESRKRKRSRQQLGMLLINRFQKYVLCCAILSLPFLLINLYHSDMTTNVLNKLIRYRCKTFIESRLLSGSRKCKNGDRHMNQIRVHHAKDIIMKQYGTGEKLRVACVQLVRLLVKQLVRFNCCRAATPLYIY